MAAVGVDAALAIIEPDASLAAARTTVARALRRVATLRRDDAVEAATRLLDALVATAASSATATGSDDREPAAVDPG